MNKTILALAVASLLIGCDGGTSSKNTTTTEDWTNHDRKDPAYAGPFVCEITSNNDVTSTLSSIRSRPVDKHGRFFGDSLDLNGACSGGDYQIKEYTWTLTKAPSRSEAQLLHEGYTGGVAPQNTLQFWTGESTFMADGKYTVTLTATNSEGVTSETASYSVDYIAAHYISGAYLGAETDDIAERILNSTIDMLDKDRPYFIAAPVVTRYVNIGPGVEVYSSGCNGWEETGYGCEVVAYHEININGTENEPVYLEGAVLRSSDDSRADLDITYASFHNGMINYNKIDNTGMEFNKISISDSTFDEFYGIVLTGEGDSVTNSYFKGNGHVFTNDDRKTMISVVDAENVLIENNTFLTDNYAVGISADITELPETDFYVINNTYNTDTDRALFDGYDATYDSHGNRLSFVTTFISY